MIKKLAIIKPKLNLIQITASQQLENITVEKLYQLNIQQLQLQAEKYIQSVVNQLQKNQLIKNSNIIINYFSNLYPVQITFSVDCQCNLLKLKQIQNVFLQNNFQIKIIL